MTLVRIIIPGEPVAKGRPRVTRAGFTYTPAKTRNAEAYARMMMVQAMRGQPPIDGPLRVAITLFKAIPRSWSKRKQQSARLIELFPTGRPDLDNYIKTIADAGNGVLWRDDGQIVSMHVAKCYGDQPRAEISVMNHTTRGEDKYAVYRTYEECEALHN